MAITHDIMQLRDDTCAALDASHNYFEYTKNAWRIVERSADKGRGFTFHNVVTGDSVTEVELAQLAPTYISGYLTSATFQDFIAIFERFMFDLLRLWLTEYPGSLSGSQLKFRSVLEAADRQEIVAHVIEREIAGLAYQRIAEWFVYLNKLAKLGSPTRDQIERLAEIKASRDCVVHNQGIANETYVSKSLGQARFAAGEAIELPEYYHRGAWEFIRSVVHDICADALAKF